MSIDLKFGDSLYVRYTKFCSQIVNNEKSFSTFRRDPRYTYMLEHVNQNHGARYLDEVLKKFKKYITLINWSGVHANDKFGQPQKCNYAHKLAKHVKLDNYLFSPTTLRYLHIGLDVLQRHINKQLNIVEIGGGYGGQCWLIFVLAPLFNVEITSYTILDLYYPTLVQDKYLRKMGGDMNKIMCITVDKYVNQPVDLLISNFALSEIQTEYQKCYADIVSQSDHGYFLWNRVDTSILSGKDLSISAETPATKFKNRLICY